MNKGLEALKRIRQETCPATYNPDFDKNECCDIIEKELKAIEIIKNNDIIATLDFIQRIAQNKEEYYFLKEVLL